jgi:hypothetical protein
MRDDLRLPERRDQCARFGGRFGVERPAKLAGEVAVESERARTIAESLEHLDGAPENALVVSSVPDGAPSPSASFGVVRVAFESMRERPRRRRSPFAGRRALVIEPRIQLHAPGNVRTGHQLATIELQRVREMAG